MRETLASLLRWAVGDRTADAHPDDAATQPGVLTLADDETQASPRLPLAETPASPKLSAWERVELARHPDRPLALDYIEGFVHGFIELHGDRRYGDDGAVVAGIGYIDSVPVAIVAQQKGRTSAERLQRNFGSARPEGYRKALRIMQLAARLGRPIVTLIDTKGADCLEDAEARGISEAIAVNQREMFSLAVPIVCAVIGEGGSGGAIGIGVGDVVLMQENAYYSVIAPESCAAILWRSPERKVEAAEALKLTALDALELGVATAVVPEPAGGAHVDPAAAVRILGEAIARSVGELRATSPKDLLEKRYERFRRIGAPHLGSPS